MEGAAPRHRPPPRLHGPQPSRGAAPGGVGGPCPQALPRPRGALPPRGGEACTGRGEQRSGRRRREASARRARAAGRPGHLRPAQPRPRWAHSPLQHQEEGEPCGNLAESGAMQTLEPRCGHSMAGEAAGRGGRLLTALQQRRPAHNSHLRANLAIRAPGFAGSRPPVRAQRLPHPASPPGFTRTRPPVRRSARRAFRAAAAFRPGRRCGARRDPVLVPPAKGTRRREAAAGLYRVPVGAGGAAGALSLPYPPPKRFVALRRRFPHPKRGVGPKLCPSDSGRERPPAAGVCPAPRSQNRDGFVHLRGVRANRACGEAVLPSSRPLR